MKTIIVDNYDSFTYNLYQLLAIINGESPIVVKNDELTWEEFAQLKYDNIILSPGPGNPHNPSDFGIGIEILKKAKAPILGVCLGHQGICSVYGGKIISAPAPKHGRISKIKHNGDILFQNIPSEFNVVRYHSLMCDKNLPSCLEVTAWSDDNIIMSIRHREKPLWGVQFHPESICSEFGKQLLTNFKVITENHQLCSKRQPQRKLLSSSLKKSNSNRQKRALSVYVKKIANSFQPADLFNILFYHDQQAIWLDSSLADKKNTQFSYMGAPTGPLSYTVNYDSLARIVKVITKTTMTIYDQDIFTFLKNQLAEISIQTPSLPFSFNCGFVGYFSYEVENQTHLSQSTAPLAQFFFLDRLVVLDHVNNILYLLSLSENEEQAEKWFNQVELTIATNKPTKITFQQQQIPLFQLSRDYPSYISDINKCLTHIRRGESYEICLTNKIRAQISIDAFSYYSVLRTKNPAPYSAYLKFADLAVACSSMERFIHIDQEGIVESKPIKGTLPRDENKLQDEIHKITLASDEKFRSENLMIVDLVRNDIGKVCQIGSVTVPTLMAVESYHTVHQLVSTVRGKLKQDVHALDCIKAAYPGGSMTGAPKIRTMEILATLEQEPRGIYSGSIGYLALNGAADFNIVIRTAIITANEISIGIGGAIIHLSDPIEEYEEILLKAKAHLHALQYYLTGNSSPIKIQIQGDRLPFRELSSNSSHL